MEKKYQIIYIWSFIIISVIVLLLLYTPIGGNLHSAVYSEESRYNVIEGVNYETQVGGFSSSTSSDYTNYSTPQAYFSESFPNVYVGGVGINKLAHSPVSYSSNYSSHVTVGQTSVSSESSFNIAGSGMLAVASREATLSKSTSLVGGGGTPFSSNGSVVMQRGAAGLDDDIDPGIDPTGSPLPLSGEYSMLIFLAFFFAFYKHISFLKK